MCDWHSDFTKYSNHKARKDYICDDCLLRRIPTGSEYFCVTWKDNGRLWTNRICRQCQILHQYMDSEFGEDNCGIAYGNLRETWSEYRSELPLEVLALSPAIWMGRV